MNQPLGAMMTEEARRRLPAGRKARLAAHVAENGQVTVAELADMFGVSVDTIRRDLDQLDADGVLIRTHGGAVSPDALPKPDTGLEIRRRVQTSAKELIGGLAASLVQDGQSILVNGGTTVLALARALRDRSDLTIATNNLLLPSEIPAGVYRSLYVFGGIVRESAQATIGPVTFTPLGSPGVDVNADLAFVAIGGLTVAGGYSTSNVAEAQMMRDMMDRADKVAVLCDSTKFGRKLFAQFAPLERADYIVTEAPPAPEFRDAFAERGIEVLTP
ncbi:DeoR/GlpR family DNA-binding transcription regulator [Demequina lignilytica]|uniref:DeoR/GlpR family DNA-binding transcription regulator n=1 Tax=Demequina lignilytica TaxID=3051663 RepID=A0AB35MH99_9MICO|nr:DeoR/GlpR family DNA-binding transcription regulator [Demequina sp. SYSU T0a273]MDN4483158.1 DeoR/GlpR family DNA-binding transcription regulator [Demequina sp. SYSU T0a273]